MPTYEYRCVECGNEIEAFQKFTDPPLTECPECPGALRKLYSPVGVVFKGSGFYATDNRTKGKTNAAAGGGSSESGTASGGSSSDSSGSTAAAGSSGTSGTGATSTSAPSASAKPAAASTPAG